MRGFSPGLLVLLIAVYATFFLVNWQAPLSPGANQPFRASLRRGVLIANWDSHGAWRIRPPVWMLGVFINPDKTPKPGWVGDPIRPYHPMLRPDFVPEYAPGHLKVPLLTLAAVLLVPPAFFAWRRGRRRPAWACAACGYDLRQTPPGSPCPECGRPAQPPRA